MYAFQVKAYSHHFVVSGYNYNAHRVVKEYARRFASVEISRKWDGSITRTLTEIYAARSADQKEYRFHINDIDTFFKHCENLGYPLTSINFTTVPMFTPPPVEMKLLDGVILRTHQVPIVEHLCKPLRSKLLELQTGGGKTLSTLAALVEIGHRAVIAIKGMYVERWKEDLVSPAKRKLDLSPKDLMIVRGSKHLKQLIALGRAGLIEAKVIIITNKTLQAFYKHYRDTNGDCSFYGCAPHDFYRIIGVGVRVIDELHQNFHANFEQDLYSHLPTTINLSATFKSDDDFINRIYRIMHPRETRAEVPNYVKYVAVYGITYQLSDRDKVKWKQRGKGFYSHVVFEESIMACPKLLANYLLLIEEQLDIHYMSVYEPGARALIFASTIEMCKLIRDHLRQSFSFNDLTINKYTGEDEYSNLVTADIAVSTIGSAGTAVDIENLITVLSTTAVSKSETAIQNMGRIRESKTFKHIIPRFVYFICTDVSKHVEYHQKKLNTYKGRALSHDTLDTRRKV